MSDQNQSTDLSEQVCMITEHVPPAYSGAGRQAILLANTLCDLGHDVSILTQTPNPNAADDMRLHIISFNSSKNLKNSLFAWQCFWWLIRNSKKYDLIHLHGLNRATWPAIIAAKLVRKPILFKYTLPADEAPDILRASRFGSIKLWLFQTMDAFIATSSKFHDILTTEMKPGNMVHKIPNGVDINVFEPLANNLKYECKNHLLNKMNWPETSIIGMYLGGIEPRKGLETLLAAWPLVIQAIPEAHLLLVGPVTHSAGESFKTHLQTQIHDLGLKNHVGFYGLCPTPETLLPLADVFLLPTESEGLPNALIEAQACGIPAVASHLDGVTTDIVLQDKTGYLIKCKDKDALAEAVISILQNTKWQSSETQQEIIQHIRHHFSITSIALHYSNLYKILVKPNTI